MRLIAIDGRSGSGKTAYTARHFPGATVLHMDDLYAGWSGLSDAPASLTEQVLAPLRRRQPAAYRRFDWHTGEFGDLLEVAPADLIVVEGVGSSAPPATRFYDERMWLTADSSVRKARALARDGETFAPHWAQWVAQEEQLFPVDPPPWADRVVDTSPDRTVVATVSARLYAIDPMGLSGAPRDEYDTEAAILADRLAGLTPHEAQSAVRDCFAQMFTGCLLPRDDVIAHIAAELVPILER